MRGTWSAARRSSVSTVSFWMCPASRARQPRHQPRDLARKLGTDVVAGIVGEAAVGVRGGGRVGGDGATRAEAPSRAR